MTCLVFTNLILALGQSHAFPKSIFVGVLLSGFFRTKTVSRVQPPSNHPCLQDITDARAGMGTTIPVPDLCKRVARGGWGQRLLSKTKLAGMPKMVFVLYPTSCIFLMHWACITPLFLVSIRVLLSLFNRSGSCPCLLSKKAQ